MITGSEEFLLGLWLTVALLAVLAEIAAPVLVGMFVAAGAATAAVSVLLGFPFLTQIGVFAFTAGLSLLALRPLFARRWRPESSLLSGPDRLVGQQATVTRTFDTEGGQIRVNGQVWSARTADGSSPAAGDTVVVDRVDGAHLLVRVHLP